MNGKDNKWRNPEKGERKKVYGLDNSLRKKNLIGHIMRGDGLMKEVMEGKMEVKRGRGSKRIGMIDELMKNEQYRSLKRRAEDRQLWRVWLPRTGRLAEH